MEKANTQKRTLQLLNAPPRWLTVLVWFYPVLATLLIVPKLSGWSRLFDYAPLVESQIPSVFGEKASAVVLLAVIFVPSLILLLLSRWFRVRFLLMLFVWWLMLDFGLGIKSRALSNAIDRSWSVLTTNQKP